MTWLASFLAPLLPKLLDWVVGSLTKAGRSIWRKYESKKEITKEKKEIDAQLKRLQKAIKVGYDGEPLTKEQKREIDEAFSALVLDY